MSQINHFQSTNLKRKLRVRSKIKGTTARPRLAFERSNQHIYMQIIDDEAGKTLWTATDRQIKNAKGTKTEKSVLVAENLVKELEKRKIKALVIDRGPYKYHGRIKAAVEVLRQAGVEV